VGSLTAHYRKRARLTQERLAELASLSVDTVASIEQGRLALQPDRAEQFDQLLDTGGR
jgi:transcriptional regulator with XRE-family HTH domain